MRADVGSGYWGSKRESHLVLTTNHGVTHLMHSSLDSEAILTDHAVCVGIIYMNWNPMLMSISHNVKFGTVEAIQKSKSATLVKFIKSIIQLYKISGFQVTTALMDGEFGHLWDELAKMGVTLNSMSCS